jgi:hypothetical protein
VKLSEIIKDINEKSLNASLISTKFNAEKLNYNDSTIAEIIEKL